MQKSKNPYLDDSIPPLVATYFLKSILKNNKIPVIELTNASIENIFNKRLSILSLSCCH